MLPNKITFADSLRAGDARSRLLPSALGEALPREDGKPRFSSVLLTAGGRVQTDGFGAA
jgi:hypothetical protein